MDTANQTTRFLYSKDNFNIPFKLPGTVSKVITSDLTIVKVNHALTELLGFSAEEIEGTNILDYTAEEFKEPWHHLQEAVWTNGAPYFKLETYLIKKDKTPVRVNVTTALFKENGDNYSFIIFDKVGYKKNIEQKKSKFLCY